MNRLNENMMLYYMLKLNKYRLDDLKGILDRDQRDLVKKTVRDYNRAEEKEQDKRVVSMRLKKALKKEPEPAFDLLNNYLEYGESSE